MHSLVDITGIPSHGLTLYWPKVEPLVKKALVKMDLSKYLTTTDVLLKCLNRDWQCWVSPDKENIDTVGITYIEAYPTGLNRLVIHLVGGESMDRWLVGGWETMKAYAKAHDCVEISIAGRKGWERVLQKVASDIRHESLYSVRI